MSVSGLLSLTEAHTAVKTKGLHLAKPLGIFSPKIWKPLDQKGARSSPRDLRVLPEQLQLATDFDSWELNTGTPLKFCGKVFKFYLRQKYVRGQR